MCFLKNKFEYFTVVTKTFISNFINLIYRKIILHHSHVTGQIIGFGQDFCNQKVRECKGFFSLLAHNLVGFDFFFLWSKALDYGFGELTISAKEEVI